MVDLWSQNSSRDYRDLGIVGKPKLSEVDLAGLELGIGMSWDVVIIRDEIGTFGCVEAGDEAMVITGGSAMVVQV